MPSTIKKSKKVKSKQKKFRIKKLKRTLKFKKIEEKRVISLKRKTPNKEMEKFVLKKQKNLKIKKKAMNNELLNLLGKLEELMSMKGEPFRARAYHNASETLMLFKGDITNVDQLKGLPAIGATILKKFKEFEKTGTLQILEKAKGNPIYQFTKIYGIGPKRAKTLVEKDGVTTIEELRQRQDELLNNVQRKGLKHYEDVLLRIQRREIDEYKSILEKIFAKLPSKAGSSFDIVGSYRRGNSDSGDIDIIVTNNENNTVVFKEFLEALQKEGLLIELLSKGKVKSLAIGRIKNYPARRLDFMYSPPDEYAFAVLYFTGSKAFNVVMRQRALNVGYSMNEHGLYEMKGKKKGPKLNMLFSTEESIFEFLGMVYKTPSERIDGRSLVLKGTNEPMEELGIVEVKSKPIKLKRRKTIKKKKTKKTKKTKIVKEHLLEFQENGITVLKKLNEAQLSKMIIYANDAYYNKKSILDDNTYDILKEYIGRTYPTNTVIEQIGAPMDKGMVALPYQMWSMDKIKPDTKALGKWLKKYKGPFVISGKLDGISALYTTEGEEPKLYTRGDSSEGTDISYIIPYLKLPTQKGITIRGELIIAEETFQKKYEGTAVGQYKNPRNFITGVVVTSKKREPAKWRDIDFVAYEVINPTLKSSDQLRWLSEHNVITVIHTVKKKITNEILSKILVSWRDTYKYEVDGIIVADDKIYPRQQKNPTFAFAFKMVLSDQIAEAKVLDVLWSPSKDGFIKPVIQIEPVRIKGVDIEYATAYNAKFIEDNKIGIGALVKMIRSGDVIPKIMEVIQPAHKAKMPDIPWKWNATHVDAVLKNTTNHPVVLLKNISHFFKKLDVIGLGRGNVTRIIAGGFRSVPAILKMTKEDFLKVEGFKERMAKKVYDSIQDRITAVELPTLMAATNIFGRGMGELRIREILKAYPDILTSKDSFEYKTEKIASIGGFAEKTAAAFVQYIPNFLDFIHETNLKTKLQQKSANKKSTHILSDKRIVMTGFRDKELIDKLTKLGAKVSSSVSKNTFIVLVKNIDTDTGSAETARENNIPLMTPAEFHKKYL
jgi:DNA ligase (NAD+)